MDCQNYSTLLLQYKSIYQQDLNVPMSGCHGIHIYMWVVVQSLNCVQLFAPPWLAACQVPWSSTISYSLLSFVSIELAMLSNHLFQ